jgi:DNA-binding transcriptional regulator YiaG
MQTMEPEEYRAAIKALGYSQEGFAVLIGSKPRTGQYWASESVPAPVATLVRLLQARPEMLAVLEKLKVDAEIARK